MSQRTDRERMNEPSYWPLWAILFTILTILGLNFLLSGCVHVWVDKTNTITVEHCDIDVLSKAGK